MSELVFRYRDQVIKSGEDPILCGILNVTPDSFSDGGLWFGKEDAIAHARELVAQGAAMIDVGGESTRPGSTPVPAKEEINRIVPVIKALKAELNVPLSVDTWKAEVAKAAIEAGADIINDITGLIGDPLMAKVVAESQAGFILMFNPVIVRPNHPSSKIFPAFGGKGVFSQEELRAFETMDIRKVQRAYFEKALARAEEAGLPRERIMLDPGIGFGLTRKENLILVKNLPQLNEYGCTTFLGVSRKRFIVSLMEEKGIDLTGTSEDPEALRDEASAYLSALGAFLGAQVLRVHSIPKHRRGAIIGHALNQAEKDQDLNLSAYQPR